MLVGLLRFPVIEEALVTLNPPNNPPVTEGANQLYVVPAGTIPFRPFVGVILNVTPSQLIAVIFVMVGTGLSETTKVKLVPTQDPDCGVTK